MTSNWNWHLVFVQINCRGNHCCPLLLECHVIESLQPELFTCGIHFTWKSNILYLFNSPFAFWGFSFVSAECTLTGLSILNVLSKNAALLCYPGREKYDWAELLYQGVTAGPDKKPKVFTSFHLSLLSLILTTFNVPCQRNSFWTFLLVFCLFSLDPTCAPVCAPLSVPPRLVCVSPVSTSPWPVLLHSRFRLTFFYAILLSLPTSPVMVTWGPAGPGVSAVL